LDICGIINLIHQVHSCLSYHLSYLRNIEIGSNYCFSKIWGLLSITFANISPIYIFNCLFASN